jgi:mannose-6-phosphate isomerase-like protein (cupin superfamily)
MSWVSRVNECNVFVMRAQGNFSEWHKHDDTDDCFFVLSGRITIQLRDRDVVLGPGELYVIPRGVEHCPKAEEESQVVVVTGGPDPATWAAMQAAKAKANA